MSKLQALQIDTPSTRPRDLESTSEGMIKNSSLMIEVQRAIPSLEGQSPSNSFMAKKSKSRSSAILPDLENSQDSTGLHSFIDGGFGPVYNLKRLEGEVLGRGSSCTVFKSIMLETLTVCAEKVVVIVDPLKRVQIVRELRSLKTSCGVDKCPYIVTLYDVIANPTDGTISVCLEFMDGGSLQDLMRSGGTMDEKIVQGISLQLLSGLHFLHARRIIHRDIKPSNALISSAGAVKLADFGLSRMLESDQSMVDSFVGTFNYMAPERMTGNAYSLLSDVWALGLTIHAVAIGKYPYLTGNNYWQLLSAIQDTPTPLPPVPPFTLMFKQFVAKACAKDPKNRSNTTELLKHAFITQPAPTTVAAATASDAAHPASKVVSSGAGRQPARHNRSDSASSVRSDGGKLAAGTNLSSKSQHRDAVDDLGGSSKSGKHGSGATGSSKAAGAEGHGSDHEAAGRPVKSRVATSKEREASSFNTGAQPQRVVRSAKRKGVGIAAASGSGDVSTPLPSLATGAAGGRGSSTGADNNIGHSSGHTASLSLLDTSSPTTGLMKGVRSRPSSHTKNKEESLHSSVTNSNTNTNSNNNSSATVGRDGRRRAAGSNEALPSKSGPASTATAKDSFAVGGPLSISGSGAGLHLPLLDLKTQLGRGGGAVSEAAAEYAKDIEDGLISPEREKMMLSARLSARDKVFFPAAVGRAKPSDGVPVSSTATATGAHAGTVTPGTKEGKVKTQGERLKSGSSSNAATASPAVSSSVKRGREARHVSALKHESTAASSSGSSSTTSAATAVPSGGSSKGLSITTSQSNVHYMSDGQATPRRTQAPHQGSSVAHKSGTGTGTGGGSNKVTAANRSRKVGGFGVSAGDAAAALKPIISEELVREIVFSWKKYILEAIELDTQHSVEEQLMCSKSKREQFSRLTGLDLDVWDDSPMAGGPARSAAATTTTAAAATSSGAAPLWGGGVGGGSKSAIGASLIPSPQKLRRSFQYSSSPHLPDGRVSGKPAAGLPDAYESFTSKMRSLFLPDKITGLARQLNCDEALLRQRFLATVEEIRDHVMDATTAKKLISPTSKRVQSPREFSSLLPSSVEAESPVSELLSDESPTSPGMSPSLQGSGGLRCSPLSDYPLLARVGSLRSTPHAAVSPVESSQQQTPHQQLLQQQQQQPLLQQPPQSEAAKAEGEAITYRSPRNVELARQNSRRQVAQCLDEVLGELKKASSGPISRDSPIAEAVQDKGQGTAGAGAVASGRGSGGSGVKGSAGGAGTYIIGGPSSGGSGSSSGSGVGSGSGDSYKGRSEDKLAANAVRCLEEELSHTIESAREQLSASLHVSRFDLPDKALTVTRGHSNNMDMGDAMAEGASEAERCLYSPEHHQATAKARRGSEDSIEESLYKSDASCMHVYADDLACVGEASRGYLEDSICTEVDGDGEGEGVEEMEEEEMGVLEEELDEGGEGEGVDEGYSDEDFEGEDANY